MNKLADLPTIQSVVSEYELCWLADVDYHCCYGGGSMHACYVMKSNCRLSVHELFYYYCTIAFLKSLVEFKFSAIIEGLSHRPKHCKHGTGRPFLLAAPLLLPC